MPERDGYIPGVPCWIDTSQPDPEAAVAFYSDLFGWEFEDVMPPDSPGKYFIARIRGGDVAAVGSVPEGAPPMAMWNTYIWVESADDTAAKVRDAGGNVVMEPFDVMDAGRMAVFTDPEGAVFCVWQAKEHKGAKVVNEHGSLNFNGLNTRDARREALLQVGVRVGGPRSSGRRRDVDDARLRRLPRAGQPRPPQAGGRGGRAPGLRGRGRGDQPDPGRSARLPAHWSVTFGVDDADATAARATELGGKVLVPPFDAPWVRMTVLADPAGATFIASKFVPENKDLATQAGSAASAS